jgi:hypothetical protein
MALGIALAALMALIGSWTVGTWDPALTLYGMALIVSLHGIAFRMIRWGQRPSTSVLFARAWKNIASGRVDYVSLIKRSALYFGGNLFVARRSKKRWMAHWPIMIGCVASMGIILPLVFGWIHFQTPEGDFSQYELQVFHIPVMQFPIDSLFASSLFHGLVFATMPVLLGVGFAMWRRWCDRGDGAVQTFEHDWLPLLLLLTIALTGLSLTVSYTFMAGFAFPVLAWSHAVAVIATLLWLPYGKLLHIFQRSARVAHMVNEASKPEMAVCARCGKPFAPIAQVEDLKEVTKKVGMDYTFSRELTEKTKVDHYQNVCPFCRRSLLVQAQGYRWAEPRGVHAAATEQQASA